METNKMEELIKSIENLEGHIDSVDSDIMKLCKGDIVNGRSGTVEELADTLYDLAESVKLMLSDIEYGVELIEKFSNK